MSTEESIDWLSRQAVASTRWLSTIPGELLTPTGRSLLDAANAQMAHTAALTAVPSHPSRDRGRAEPSKTPTTKATYDIQRPLMTDVHDPK